MKNRNRKKIILLGVLALIAWYACAISAQRVSAFKTGASVQWKAEEGVSPAQLLCAERYAQEDGAEEFPAAILWRTKAGTVSLENIPRSLTPDIFQVFGDPANLWPRGFVSGNWPVRGDDEGCTVSEDLADALWGSSQILGKAVILEKKSYYVRGVFRGEKNLMVIQSASSSEELYNHLLVSFSKSSSKEDISAFLSSAGLPQGDVLDLALLAWCLNALTAMPAIVLVGGILFRLLRRLWRLRTVPLLLVQFLIPAILGGAVVLWVAGFSWKVPALLIPNRWSDFSFWSDLTSQLEQTLREVLMNSLTSWDMSLWVTVLGCLVLVPITTALVVLWAELTQARTGRSVVLGGLGWMACLFGLTLASASTVGLTISRGMWLLPPLWLAMDWCLNKHADFLEPKGELKTNEEI